VLGCRDAGYLRWRYEVHPEKRYELLEVASNGRLRAYGIMERYEGVLFLTDYCCVDDSSGDALFEALIEHAAADRSLQAVHVRQTEPPWMTRRFRLADGFVRRVDQVPVLWSGNDPSRPGRTRGQWFMTWGDKDI
jgi:hypothetical protein